MKTLVLIFLLAIPSIFSQTPLTYNVKCPSDKKIKLKDVCAIYETEEKGDYNRTYYIKDECGKNERCKTQINTNYYQCQKTIERLSVGEKCSFDFDCVSNRCRDKKCTEYPSNSYCKAGRYAYNHECYDNLEENGDCTTRGVGCPAGYGCLGKTGKKFNCTKYHSLGQGQEVGAGNEKFCQSGYEKYGYCLKIGQITQECTKEKRECKFKVEGLSNITEITENCVSYYPENDKNKETLVCPYGGVKTALFEKFIERFNKLDFKKINKNEEGATYNNYYYDTQLKVLKETHDYFQQLNIRGFVDKDGNVLKDKKCEYNWYIQWMSSSFIKITSFLLGLLALLF